MTVVTKAIVVTDVTVVTEVPVVTEMLRRTPDLRGSMRQQKKQEAASFVRVKFERCAEPLRDGFLR